MKEEFTAKVQAQNRVALPKELVEARAIKPGSFLRLRVIAVVGENLS